MKLKYNHNGETNEIPLSTKKPEGKRLAVRHDDQNFYAPLVDAGDATASNLRTVMQGQVYAVRQMSAPEIENILIEPPRVSVMQGQSATAIVSASGNEAVTGLSYSIANNPTWITIADECILIQPSDNDLGEAVVEVIAKDTGSNASMSTAFVAEALLRPIISSLSVVPPAVTVQQGQSATAQIEAVANSAVTGLSYSLDGAPSWVSNDYSMICLNPTTADSGTSTVNVVAYDTNSSARAETQFVATAEMVPDIYGVIASPSNATVNQGESTVITLSADYNTAVTGIEYSLENAPAWMTLSGNQITVAPTDTDLGTVTVFATARDTGSHAQASTQFVATAQELQPEISGITVQPSPALKHSRVVGWQGSALYYPLTCTANSKVTSVRYSLAPSENNPKWLSVYNYATLLVSAKTVNSALGDTATVTLVAYDTESTARATTEVCASVSLKPALKAPSIDPMTVVAYHGTTGTRPINISANAGVESVTYELINAPDWMTVVGDNVSLFPAEGTHASQNATIVAYDTSSSVSTQSVFKAVATTVMPSITNLPNSLLNLKYRDRMAVNALALSKKSYTYGLKYTVQADHPEYFQTKSGSDSLYFVVPSSVPVANDSISGTAAITVSDQTGLANGSITRQYIADLRASNYIIRENVYLMAGNDTLTSLSVSEMDFSPESTIINPTVEGEIVCKYPVAENQCTLYVYATTSSANVKLTANDDRTVFHFRYTPHKYTSWSGTPSLERKTNRIEIGESADESVHTSENAGDNYHTFSGGKNLVVSSTQPKKITKTI